MNKSISGENKAIFKLILLSIYAVLAVISYKLGFRPFTEKIEAGQSLFLLQLGRTMGIFAISLLLTAPILALKSKILDRAFSLDQMYWYHKATALLCITMATAHPLLIDISKLIPEPGPGEAEWPELLGTIGLIALWSLVCTSIFRKFLMLGYEGWRKTHLVSAGLRYAAVIHVFSIQPEARNGGFFYFLASIAALSIGFALWDKLIAPFALKNERGYMLKSTKEVAPDIFELILKPQPEKPIFEYSPGQFAYLKIKSDTFLYESHPFTIASSSTDKEKLAFYVKGIGDWTKKLSNLPTETEAEIIGPFGKFSPFLFNGKTEKLIFIAGGIGITPFIGLIRSLSNMENKIPVLLLWSSKTSKDFLQIDEFETLQKTYPEFQYKLFVSDEKPHGVFIGSRINKDILSDHLKKFVPGTQAMVCGPPMMMKAVKTDLISIGFPKENIHYEDFSYLD